MNKGVKEPAENEQTTNMPCRYCRDLICADAVICRTCGEPQKWFRVLLFVGAAIVKFHTSGAARKQTTTTSLADPINARDANVLRVRRQAQSGVYPENDPAVAAELAQIEEEQVAVFSTEFLARC